MPPTKVGSRANFEYSFNFRLTMEQQREVMQSRPQAQAAAAAGARASTLQVAVRCFPLDLFESAKGRVHDLTRPPFYPPHCWPLESALRVNKHYVHMKQRQVYFHGHLRKWKGGSEPLDVYLHSRVGPNALTLQHKDEGKTYVLMVQLVRVVPVPDLFERVRAYPDTPSVADSLERIKDSFKATCIDSDDEGGGGGAAGAMATVTRLSLRCPLGLMPIQTPARGKDCQHLQCFDLDTFLRFNERGCAAGWKCGVCHRTLTVDELRVDAFMQDVLRQIEARREANEDLDSIEIDYEGQWKLFSAAAAAASRKRKADEARAEAIDDDDSEDEDAQGLDRKPPPPLPATNGAGNGGGAAASAASAAPHRPAASEPIDLTLSSDEEDNAPPSRGAAVANHGEQRARALATVAVVELVDEDSQPLAMPAAPTSESVPPSVPAHAHALAPPSVNPAIPPYRPHIHPNATRHVNPSPVPPRAPAAAMAHGQQQYQHHAYHHHHQQQQQNDLLNAVAAYRQELNGYGEGAGGGSGGGGNGGGGFGGGYAPYG